MRWLRDMWYFHMWCIYQKTSVAFNPDANSLSKSNKGFLAHVRSSEKAFALFVLFRRFCTHHRPINLPSSLNGATELIFIWNVLIKALQQERNRRVESVCVCVWREVRSGAKEEELLLELITQVRFVYQSQAENVVNIARRKCHRRSIWAAHDDLFDCRLQYVSLIWPYSRQGIRYLVSQTVWPDLV